MTPEESFRSRVFHILEMFDLDDFFEHTELDTLVFISDPEVKITLDPDGYKYSEAGVWVDLKGDLYRCDDLPSALSHFVETMFGAPYEGDEPPDPMQEKINARYYEFED